jgi:hypothetical protein
VDHGVADLSVDKRLSILIADYQNPLINIYDFIASMASAWLLSKRKIA